MMKRMLYMATFCAAAVGHHVPAVADSPGIPVTPSNLDKHDLRFTVSVACRPENDPKLCDVVIVVANKDAAVAPRLQAVLEVRDDSGFVVKCPIEGKTTERGISYQFSVSHRCARTSNVIIHDANRKPSDYPSEELMYWLSLGEFLASQAGDLRR